MLRTGVTVVKVGRRGSPAQRQVWLPAPASDVIAAVTAQTALCVAKNRQVSPAQRKWIKFGDIKRLTAGKAGFARPKRARSYDNDKCGSVGMADRSFDFVFYSKQARDDFLTALRDIVKGLGRAA